MFGRALLLALAVAACGPAVSGSDEHPGPDGGYVPPADWNHCPTGTQTTISGTVTTPNGLDPVPGAVVYVPSSGITDFPQTVACDVCGGDTSNPALVSTTTGPDGTFTLGPLPTDPGAQPGFTVGVVVEKGRFRRAVQLQIS
jgi:hypothetical protein